MDGRLLQNGYILSCLRAHNRIWTGDLILTKNVLYLLSYVGQSEASKAYTLRSTALHIICERACGRGRIRTTEGVCRLSYSQIPLSTRAPAHFKVNEINYTVLAVAS